MKTKILVIGMATMIGLAGCSMNEEVSVPKQDGVIGFSIATNKAITRSPIDGATAMQSDGFDIWGYRKSDSHQQVGTNNKPVVATYSNTNTAWNLATAAYWPADASADVDFYAIWPTMHYEIATSIVAGTQTVKYIRKSAESDVKDLMYAKKTTNKTNAAGGKVMLYFKHALSQVQFKGKTAAVGMEVKVKSLQLCNLNNEGTFTFPSAETAASSDHGVWGTLSNPKTDYMATINNDVTLNSITNAESLGTPFLLLPQSFTPWNTTTSAKKSIIDADAANESYLKLEVYIKQNGEDILGSNSSYATTYIPLPNPTNDMAFKSGKKYTYTLKFGGGKKEDGDDQFAPIEFDVDVEPWGDAAEENLPL